MMPLFMSPAAFRGLLTAFILAGIYLFRRQARDVKVSSLMFFSRLRHSAEGGRRLTRPQTPLILFVEIAILFLLVLAAANPRAITGEKLIPVVLVLDDSLSMLVNEPDSPRSAAAAYLDHAIFSQSAYRITILRAGNNPDIIGRHDMTGNEAARLISNWRCHSPTADLFKAMRYVVESFPTDTSVVIISDRPSEKPLTGRMQWLAFGRPVNNLAVTAANRYSLGNADRCFLEFTSFASQPTRLEAEILMPEKELLIERIDVMLQPGETRRLRFIVKDTEAVVKTRILNDPVAFDNFAWLLPVRRKPVEVELQLQSPLLRNIVERAISASGIAMVVASSSQLLISEKRLPRYEEGLWQYNFHVASQPAAFSGVVAVDKDHPLTAGLPPVRAAWAIDPELAAGGRAIMSAAAMPLLTVAGLPEQNLAIMLNFSPAYSDLQKSPLWPVMFWNLLNWRQQFNPGPDAFNYRSGSDINLTLPTETKNAGLFDHSGKQVAAAVVWRRRAIFQSAYPGLYNIRAGSADWAVAVNLCSPVESDLTSASSSTLPALPLADDAMLKLSDVRWWFILPALLLMALHQFLVARRRATDAAY